MDIGKKNFVVLKIGHDEDDTICIYIGVILHIGIIFRLFEIM